VNFVQWVPLVAALGVGSVIGNYVGAGKARREVRSAVLKALASTENARWIGLAESNEYRHFREALRELETAALIARIPRLAVQHYTVLAVTARGLSDEDYEDKGGDEDMGAGGIESSFARVVRDSAEIVTQLAWRPWLSRVRYRVDLKRLRERAAAIDAADVKRQLASAQYSQGRLASPLSELVDKQFPSR
jgi:hypothetical protein